ncbi:hypothetical protein N665_0283s0018 [Sinapis alba]|nr:hypothetical protein N665_0283s0018 [Sinapis alba]
MEVHDGVQELIHHSVITEQWHKLAFNLLGSDYSTDWDTLMKLMHCPTFGKVKKFIIRYCFQAATIHVRRERNNRKHGKPETASNQLLRMVDKNVRNKISTLAIESGQRTEGRNANVAGHKATMIFSFKQHCNSAITI